MSVSFKFRLRDAWRSGAVAGLVLVIAACFAPQARACELRLARAPGVVRIDYDPFIIARPPGRLDFDLVNDGAEACDVELRLVDLDGQPMRTLDLGGVRIGFQPREGAAIATGGAEPNRFRLMLAPGASASAELDAVVLSDAVPEAGEYRAALRAEVGPASGDPLIRIDPLEVVLASPPRAQMNIAGAAGAFGSSQSVEVIDFGEAMTGAMKRTFLQVRANTEARLTFQSENAGVLRQPGSTSEESVIEYRVSLDGRLVDLRHGTTRVVNPPRDIDGQSLSLDFELGLVGSQMAGYYEDLLTISISPN